MFHLMQHGQSRVDCEYVCTMGSASGSSWSWLETLLGSHPSTHIHCPVAPSSAARSWLICFLTALRLPHHHSISRHSSVKVVFKHVPTIWGHFREGVIVHPCLRDPQSASEVSSLLRGDYSKPHHQGLTGQVEDGCGCQAQRSTCKKSGARLLDR